MNWKLVATLMVGTALLGACGAANQQPTAPSDTRTNMVEAPGGGAKPPEAETTIAPTTAPVAPAAKKDVIVHD